MKPDRTLASLATLAAAILLAVGCGGAPPTQTPVVPPAPAAGPAKNAKLANPKPTTRLPPGTWLSVQITPAPTTRVRCAIDAQDGAHVMVEWDPVQSNALAKLVQLPTQPNGTQRTWRASCSSDPIVVTSSGANNFLALSFADVVSGDQHIVLAPAAPPGGGPSWIALPAKPLDGSSAVCVQAKTERGAADAPRSAADTARAAADAARKAGAPDAAVKAKDADTKEKTAKEAEDKAKTATNKCFDVACGAVRLATADVERARGAVAAAPAGEPKQAALLAERDAKQRQADARSACESGEPILEGRFTDAINGSLKDASNLRVRVAFRTFTPAEATTLLPAATLPPSARLLRSPTAAIPNGRAAGELSPAVAELFSILAEIAVDRAKSQAFELVADIVRDMICNELTWQNNQELRDLFKDVKPAPTGPLLPKTCDAVKHLRLQEIASSAETLYGALVGDLTSLAMKVAAAQLGKDDARVVEAFQPALQTLVRMLVDSAVKRVPPGKQDAQLLLAQLADVDWAGQFGIKDKPTCDNEPEACAFACGLEIGLAVTEACVQEDKTCTPADVAARTADQKYAPNGCKELVAKLGTTWPDLAKVVLDALAIAQSAPSEDPKAVFRKAASLLFGILDRRFCVPSDSTASCKYVRGARDITIGIVDEKAPQVIVAATSVVTQVLEGISDGASQDAKDKNDAQRVLLVKLTKLTGAVTAYAATYATDAKGDPEKTKEAHESRKKAIEGLIDGTTDRSGRGGDWVVSVGANAGFIAGGEKPFAATTALMAPQLSLPVGIAVQKLPRIEAGAPGRYGGFHAQISVVDIGQFLAYSSSGSTAGTLPKPLASSPMMIGAEIGALVGKPTNAVTLGLDVRYAPGILSNQSEPGAVRFGVVVGYYVPFFDFN